MLVYVVEVYGMGESAHFSNMNQHKFVALIYQLFSGGSWKFTFMYVEVLNIPNRNQNLKHNLR